MFKLIILLGFMFIFVSCSGPAEISGQNITDSEISSGPVRMVTPIAWPLSDSAERSGFSLRPTVFSGISICTSTSFELTTPQGFTSPIVSINGLQTASVYPLTGTTFEIIPATSLSYNSLYVLRLYLSDEEYISWAFQTVERFMITRILPSNQATNVPVNTGIEITFSHSDHTPLENYFSINPPVEGRFIQEGNTVIFLPRYRLAQGTVYTVVLDSGVRLTGTNGVIEERLVFSFETRLPAVPTAQLQNESQEHAVIFFNRYVEFPSFEPVEIGFRVSNIRTNTWRPDINVSIYKFLNSERAVTAVLNIMNRPSWSRHNIQRNFINITENQFYNVASFTEFGRINNRSEVLTFPENLPAGFYLVNATIGTESSQAIVQISDIAVQLVGDENQSIFWVNNMQTGNAIDSALITHNNTGRTIVTDNNGLAVTNHVNPEIIEAWRIQGDGLESVVFVRNMGLSRGNYWEWHGGWYSSWDAHIHHRTNSTEHYWAVLQLDRTLFQRDDLLYFWGFIQSRRTDEPITSVTATITQGAGWHNRNNFPIYRMTVPVEYSAFSGEINLPNLEPGSYIISVYHENRQIMSMFFTVEDYVTPPYRVVLTNERRAIFLNETALFNISTEFFDGTPVPYHSLTYNFWLGGSGLIGSGIARTNINGLVNVQSGRMPDLSSHAQGQRRLNFEVSATLPEIGFTRHSDFVTVFINDISVRPRATRTGSNASITVDVNEINLDRINSRETHRWDYLGDSLEGQVLNVRINRVWWERERTGERFNYVTRTVTPIYRNVRHEQRVNEFNITTDENGRATHDFVVSNEDMVSYHASVRTNDGNGRLITHEIWVGRDWTGFFQESSNPNPRLEIMNERPNGFNVGDEVELAVLRGDEVISRGRTLYVTANNRIITFHTDYNETTFTFEESHLPNAFVYAFHFNGHVFFSGRVMRRGFQFNPEYRQLQINIELDSESYRPGDYVTVSVITTDLNGNPKPANVNIALVDEALFALRNFSVNTLIDLFKPVTSSLRMFMSTHRHFSSDGISSGYDSALGELFGFDGGSGGGGESTLIRELFMDTAYFKSLRTNAMGEAEFTFPLPHNITSWRLTASGITTDFYAGNTVKNVIVTQPMFIHYSLNSTFLTGDKPEIGINVVGTSLSGNERLTIRIFDDNNLDNMITTTASPFERINIPLWEMNTPGAHSLVMHVASSNGFSDAIRHNFHVLESYRSVTTGVFYEVNLDTVFNVNSSGFTNITFTDAGRSQFIPELFSMRRVRNERLEMLLLHRNANRLLAEYFPDMNIYIPEDTFNPLSFQQEDGGLGILTYAGSTLQTTVRVMPFLLDDLNISNLRDYLYHMAFESGAGNRLQALYGLAILQFPVLNTLHDFLLLDGLSISDTAYLALAFNALGETEIALYLYQNRILPNIQQVTPYFRVNVGANRQDVLYNTAIVALLALELNTAESDGLNRYVIRHPFNDFISAVTRLGFISSKISYLPATPASITFTFLGETVTRDLSRRRSFTLRIPVSQLNYFELTDVSGSIGAVSLIQTPLNEAEAVDSDIIITRRFINPATNQPADTFNQGDRVRVEISVLFPNTAMSGNYLITDFLPSGLVFAGNQSHVTRNFTTPGSRVWPSAAGQEIRFTVFVSQQAEVQTAPRTFFYYARVINPGTFRAEGTIIQFTRARDYFAAAVDEVVVIRGD